MNYEKQKPLTQEEIDYINSKENLCVVELATYPKGYIHVKIAWKLPINITRNEDSFWWGNEPGKGLTESNKENYWVVYPDGRSERGFDFDTKQFKDIDKALEYGVKEYKKWLKSRQRLINVLEKGV